MQFSKYIESISAPVSRLFNAIKTIDPEAKGLVTKFVAGAAIGVVASVLRHKGHAGWGAVEVLAGREAAKYLFNRGLEPDEQQRGSQAVTSGILVGIGATELAHHNTSKKQTIFGILSSVAGGVETLRTIVDYRKGHAVPVAVYL